MKHEHHIKRLRVHRNILYLIVVLLLALQVISFISISSKAAYLVSEQDSLKKDLVNYVDEVKKENQVSLNEILKIISQQRSDFEGQIELLKSSQEDFSGIIEDAVKGVVSVRTDKSIGSGFIVDYRGYIVTNYHVIDGAEAIRVSTYDGEDYVAELVNGDSFSDIALLKSTGVFHPLELESSENVHTGDKVIAIGNPLGLSFSVTEGIVSAVDREGPNGLNSYIQTDVTLNPGNSGGPLINREGKVVGVNNFKIGGAESLGFSLESDIVKEKVNEFVGQELIA